MILILLSDYITMLNNYLSTVLEIHNNLKYGAKASDVFIDMKIIFDSDVLTYNKLLFSIFNPSFANILKFSAC